MITTMLLICGPRSLGLLVFILPFLNLVLFKGVFHQPSNTTCPYLLRMFASYLPLAQFSFNSALTSEELTFSCHCVDLPFSKTPNSILISISKLLKKTLLWTKTFTAIKQSGSVRLGINRCHLTTSAWHFPWSNHSRIK